MAKNAPGSGSKKTRAPLTAGDYMARGILIGGGVGVLGALLGFGDNLFRAAGVGMIGGFLAGLTLARRVKKK